MFDAVVIEFAIIVLLILANGFLAAAEMAIVSARKGRLEQQAHAGQRGAAAALDLAENPNRFLSTVQIGITLIGTLAAAFGGASLAQALESQLRAVLPLAPYADSIALGMVVLLISYLSLVLGELVPKRLALQNAEQMASAVALVMRTLARLLAPAVSALTISTELVLRLLGRHAVPEQPITEDDVMALVREGTAAGSLEAAEKDLIDRVFTFTERRVRTIMTPRTQMVAVAIDTPIADVLRTVTESGYSRIPVYQATLDQIVGILYVKDLLHAWGQSEAVDLGTLMRPPLYVLESQRAVIAFQELKRQRSALAIVLDEYGQVAGVVSIEDMLEEVVGEIANEYDELEAAIVRRADGSYLVDGLLPIADLETRLQLSGLEKLARERDVETVAGLVLTLLGRLPTAGDTVQWQEHTFEVVDMDQLRIDKVLIHPPHVRANEQTVGVLAGHAVLSPSYQCEGQRTPNTGDG